MNCYRHPEERAVAMCQAGCGRGLCRDCAQRYEEPFCEHCYTAMASEYAGVVVEGRAAIIRQLTINGVVLGTLVAGILAMIIIGSTSQGEPPPGLAFFSLLVIPTLIWSFANFRKLMDKFTEWTGMVFFTSINNWLLIFLCGCLLITPFALIILPLNIIMDIKRLQDLS